MHEKQSGPQIHSFREYHRGITDVELTTSGFLFDPKEAFEIGDRLGMNLEIYPMLPHEKFSVLTGLAKRAGKIAGFELPIPHGLTIDEVDALQKKYTNTKVTRIHLPFSYDRRELVTMPFHTQGTLAKARSAGWIFFFGSSTNMYGVEMAERFQADINAHTNVVAGFANEQHATNLDDLRSRVNNVFVENDPSYASRFVEDPRLQGDPIFMAENLIDMYKLDGLVLGVDHMLEYTDRTNQGVLSVLESAAVREHTQVMHIAGSNHDVLLAGNGELTDFLKATAKTYFSHPVKAALDFNPQQLAKHPKDERLLIIKKATEYILQTQQQE